MSFFPALFYGEDESSFYAWEGNLLPKRDEERARAPFSIENQNEDGLSEIVVVFEDPEKGRPRLSVSRQRVIASGRIPAEKKLIKTLYGFLGGPVDAGGLERIREEIVDFYKSHGYPFVSVSLPARNRMSSGKVALRLFVARIGTVKVEGARWFSEEEIEQMISMEEGDYIRSSDIATDLNRINSNPFRDAQMVFQKGPGIGETDVTVISQDRLPLRVYGSYINTGNIIAGDSRWATGFNWGDAFLLGHELNYVFITANSVNKWWSTGVNYIAPLSWRHTFKVFGSYTEIRPNLRDRNLHPFNQKGKGWQLGGRYVVPLPPIVSYLHNVFIGYDFKRTNNFLDFSQNLIFNNFIDVDQFLLGYDGRLERGWGMLVCGATFYFSPGGLTHFNRSKFFQVEQPGARANYIYARGTLDFIFALPQSFSWSLSTLGQWPSGKLLPSEQLSLGGYQTIRGYDENEIVSDRGLLVKNELRSPTFPVFLHNRKKIVDELQFVAFLDFGYANDVNPNILAQEDKALASAGPGVRYQIEEYLVFRFDYGFQLDHISRRIFASGDHNRMNLSLTVGF